MDEKKNLFERIAEGQIWKSIFRGGGAPKTRRQRMMVVLNSVFLHLHPVRLPKHAVKLKFTWCMGGLSFFIFLILFILRFFISLIIIEGILKPDLTVAIAPPGNLGFISIR